MECPVCYEAYSASMPDSKPLTLRCGHSYCRGCVRSLLESTSRQCPVCRQRIPYSDSADTLPVNYAVITILESLQSSGGRLPSPPSTSAPTSTPSRPSSHRSPIPSTARTPPPRPLTVEDVGCIVMLRPSFRDIEDAISGPLAPGQAGRVVVVNRAANGSVRVGVQASDDRTFNYNARALVPFPRPGDVVTHDTANMGFRVKRGPDWEWDEQDGHGVGTLERPDTEAGWWKVIWDSGMWNNYRIGGVGGMNRFDLVFASPLVTEGLERLSVGSRVMLSAVYEHCGDAKKGCLTGTDQGEILQDDRSAKPYQVQNVVSGRKWWFEAQALVPFPSPGDLVTQRVARKGFRVRKGPDFVEESSDAVSSSGTLHESHREGWHTVLWDSGRETSHRIGAGGLYELIFDEPLVGGPVRPAVLEGDEVMLVRTYMSVARASNGPLRPGMKGEVVSRSPTNLLLVRAPNGSTFYYVPDALVRFPRPSQAVTDETAVAGLRVIPGPGWEASDEQGQTGGRPGVLMGAGGAPGWARVQWEASQRISSHRVGADHVFALAFADPVQVTAETSRFRVGARVMLAADASTLGGDVNEGPLRQGEPGVIIEEDGSAVPYRVRSERTGQSWWYPREALNLFPSPGEIVTETNARAGFLVVRGPDFHWGNQDGGPGAVGSLADPDPTGSRNQPGWIEVLWSTTGLRNVYRIGNSNRYDLVFADPVVADARLDALVRSIDSDSEDEGTTGLPAAARAVSDPAAVRDPLLLPPEPGSDDSSDEAERIREVRRRALAAAGGRGHTHMLNSDDS